MSVESESKKRAREAEFLHGDAQDSTALSLMMVIPEWAAPKIIGKGGGVVKQIEGSTGARVSFLSEYQAGVSVPGRVCSIVGTPKSCTLATYAISRILTDQPELCAEWNATVSSGRSGINEAKGRAPPPPEPMHVQPYHPSMLMPQPAQPPAPHPYQPRHDIPQPPPHYWQQPYQPEHRPELSNPWAPQPYQNPMDPMPQPPSHQYRPPPMHRGRGPPGSGGKAVVDVVVARDLSGALIGRRGENINGIQTRTGAKVDLIRATDQTSDHCLRVAGEPAVVREGLQHALSILQVLSAPAGERPYINLDQPVPLENIMGMTTHCSVNVPAEKVGSIIGAGGENVRVIESVSGAKVSFEKGGPHESRQVSVKGGNQSVVRAVGLIFSGLDALDGDKKLPADFFLHV